MTKLKLNKFKGYHTTYVMDILNDINIHVLINKNQKKKPNNQNKNHHNNYNKSYIYKYVSPTQKHDKPK